MSTHLFERSTFHSTYVNEVDFTRTSHTLVLMKTDPAAPFDPDILLSWLSDEERVQFLRRKRQRAQHHYLTTRFLAKLCVSQFANCHPSDVELINDNAGAPLIRCVGKPINVAVSVSHCDAYIALAFAPDGEPVGCDIEPIKPNREVVAISETYFSEAEQRIISNSEQKALDFYLHWTSKEAAAKALNQPLAQSIGAQVKSFLSANKLLSMHYQIEQEVLAAVVLPDSQSCQCYLLLDQIG